MLSKVSKGTCVCSVQRKDKECERSVVVDKKLEMVVVSQDVKRSSKEHQKMMHCTNLEGDPKNRA